MIIYGDPYWPWRSYMTRWVFTGPCSHVINQRRLDVHQPMALWYDGFWPTRWIPRVATLRNISAGKRMPACPPPKRSGECWLKYARNISPFHIFTSTEFPKMFLRDFPMISLSVGPSRLCNSGSQAPCPRGSREIHGKSGWLNHRAPRFLPLHFIPFLMETRHDNN